MVFTALGILVGPAIPASWGVEFAAPVLFVSLMMAASDRRDKLVAAALAMGIALAFGHLPHRAAILVAVAISVSIMLLVRRRLS
jgi:predicted branched-subunit amino acid permease